MDNNLKLSLEQQLSKHFDKPTEILHSRSVGGGCINQAFVLEASLGKFFLKINVAKKFPGMFELEAKGLELLSSANCIRIPKTIFHGNDGKNTFLVLEWISPGKQQPDFWENFGTSLASLHQNTHEFFGLEHNNYIGSLLQKNNPTKDWTTFFIEQRLSPQIELAGRNGYLQSEHAKSFSKLFSSLKNIFPAEPPALLHGDLWSGNFMTGDDGYACIYDPAVYYGNREAEIAFTLLFGGFDPLFYSAYHNAFPLEQGF